MKTALLSLLLCLPALADAPPAPVPTEPRTPARPADDGKLLITEATVVLLDGVACKLADVPGTAAIVHLEVAADKKTIIRIEFRSQPKP